MNINDLRKFDYCPICNSTLDPSQLGATLGATIFCPLNNYSAAVFYNIIRFSINNSLVCFINLNEYSIYKATHVDGFYPLDTIKIFPSNIIINTISNSKNIKDLQIKLANLYNSPFS